MLKLNRYVPHILSAVLILTLAYGVWSFVFQREHRTTSLGAAASSIERLAALSVIIEGTVVGEGKGINLRRNAQNPKKESSAVTPGTEYSKRYLFFIEPAAQGEPYYYSPMLPNIFEQQAGKLVPVVNNKRYLEVYEDKEVSESDFYSRLHRALESQGE